MLVLLCPSQLSALRVSRGPASSTFGEVLAEPLVPGKHLGSEPHCELSRAAVSLRFHTPSHA